MDRTEPTEKTVIYSKRPSRLGRRDGAPTVWPEPRRIYFFNSPSERDARGVRDVHDVARAVEEQHDAVDGRSREE